MMVTPAMVEEYLWWRKETPKTATKTGELKWSTVQTLYGNAVGGIKSAPIRGQSLTRDPTDPGWARIEKYIRKQVYKEEVGFPQPMTLNEAARVWEELQATQARNYFALWWMTAARPGDAAELEARNVTLTDTGVSVKFVVGKGVSIRGPYTVFTDGPQRWKRELKHLGHGRVISVNDKPVVRKYVLAVMKTVNKSLEERSVRRGALQLLGDTGTDDATLLQFSGHKTVQMLYRYLDWGKHRQVAKIRGMEAAKRAWDANSVYDGKE